MKSPLILASAVEVLNQVFPGLNGRDYAELIERGDVADYPAGYLLCNQGKTEDVFYIIMTGKVEAYQMLGGDEQRHLNVMGAHEFFGELALIHRAPRGANVRTLEPTTVLEIHGPEFESVLFRSPAMAITVMREVGNRLRANDEGTIRDLREKNVQLETAYHALADQERARTEFITTISHELRTPLTSANGFVQLIRSQAVSNESLPEVLGTVGGNLNTIMTLVNDILFVYEMEEIVPAFEPVDIGEILNAVAEANKEYADHCGIAIIAEVAEGLPKLEGHAQNLGRAFSALVNNAIKFSPEGGNVCLSAAKEGMILRVAVSDSGIGIPPKHLAHIFERFYHVDEMDGQRFGGVGLGLAIAKHLVERHGGKIEVMSSGVPGEGATFRVNLPVS
jgi:signal transduction histidine kinase